jgi:hypothetical protein
MLDPATPGASDMLIPCNPGSLPLMTLPGGVGTIGSLNIGIPGI